MGILSKTFLYGLLLFTLVCVGLRGQPGQSVVHGPLQPQSIRSAQDSDFECLLLARRTQPSDCTQANDHRLPLLGILPSANDFTGVSYWLAPDYQPAVHGIAPRLVVVEPRARAPPQRT